MLDTTTLIMNILKSGLEDVGFFKSYYDADPDLIPAFNLPALIVSKLSDESGSETNADDAVTDTIVVKAVLDKRDDWVPGVTGEDLTEKKLRRIMEQRTSTGRWSPNTIKGILRKPLDGDRRIAESMSTVYGVDQRPENLLSAEVQLTIEVKYSVDVS